MNPLVILQRRQKMSNIKEIEKILVKNATSFFIPITKLKKSKFPVNFKRQKDKMDKKYKNRHYLQNDSMSNNKVMS